MTTTRRLRLHTPQATALAGGMADLQRELGLPSEFSPEVEQSAIAAAANPRLPDEDRTDIEFVTIDPPDAMDLDQAMFVERNGEGYRVHYAIADVAAFVTAGDAIDLEAHRRGETLYGADAKIPLHPKALSEDAASLLPNQVRPALLWTIELDASGEGIAVDVRRARIRSRAKLDYAGVQQQIDSGKAGPMWTVLREIGELRKQREPGVDERQPRSADRQVPRDRQQYRRAEADPVSRRLPSARCAATKAARRSSSSPLSCR
jgi:exoribonuclease R